MTELEPITRQEHYLSAIAGETELPSDLENPRTREEIYLYAILERIAGIGEPTQEQISIAVAAYFDEHGIDDLFIDSADIAEVLEG